MKVIEPSVHFVTPMNEEAGITIMKRIEEVTKLALMGFYTCMPELFEDICEEVTL